MDGHLEPLAAIIRIGGAHGEPYTWSATLRYLNPTEVEILGAVRAPTPSEWRTVKRICKAAGIRRGLIRRVRGGMLVAHWTE